MAIYVRDGISDGVRARMRDVNGGAVGTVGAGPTMQPGRKTKVESLEREGYSKDVLCSWDADAETEIVEENGTCFLAVC